MIATAERLNPSATDDGFRQALGAELLAEGRRLEANAINAEIADILQRSGLSGEAQTEQFARTAGAVLLGSKIEKAGERQARYDLQTQFSELVDGSMRTEFELIFDGRDLYGQDGRSMSDITQKSLRDAHKTAQANPSLLFEARRRGYEKTEIELAIEMAKGNRPNTMIIVSDFPPELVNATADVGGYSVTRKQTMLRVLARLPNGKIKMYSRSLDGSDRRALEAIYAHMGGQAAPGELLGQRMSKDLSAEQQLTLIDELTSVYDRSLTAQRGGAWHAGRSPADYRNTYDFVCRQHDIIDEGVRLKNLGRLTPEIMYKMAATMNARFKGVKVRGGDGAAMPVIFGADMRYALYQELEMNGRQAQRMGRTFSACGETLTAKNSDDSSPSSSTEQDMKEAGYGNQSAVQPESGGVCVYVHDGCYCCGLNTDGTVRTSKMKVMARRDSSGIAHCLRGGCNAWLAGDGKTGYVGDIAKKAERLKTQPPNKEYELQA